MAIIKCKMCGGDLALIEGQSVAECEYCGSRQTVPTADNEKKLTLFARANRLRVACEFDKAAGIYEAIVADYPEEAEAYWGLVLCKYGIEYVDDPATGKKIPTCHRSSFDSLMDDSDFEQALENADAVARRVYREEAKQIEEIRKGIIAVSSNEEPYDIFICYKETDENGDRTLDSVLAQDIYDALTSKGYRTFFARITLEDKLGQEYEPYIFAALNSARIMLAVGTDYEYYNAVWVKNEWSRFLKLMANDREKTLIPCFKNLDAYDMPKEFARLQAQDLGKVGAMQDLLRGIEKILPRHTVAAQSVQKPDANASALTIRGQFALEDGDWKKAAEYFERALDQNPQDGGAYLGKVLVSLRISSLSQLDGQLVKLEGNKDFERAIRFSDPQTSRELAAICESSQKKYLVKCFTEGLRKIIKEKRAVEYSAKMRIELEPVRNRIAGAKGMLQICNDRVVSLNVDGTVAAVGENGFNQCNVGNWTDISMVALGMFHTVGLKADGTVVAVGDNTYRQTDVASWEEITKISAGALHTVGLKKDGTVVATGENKYGQCEVEGWRNVIQISTSRYNTLGLCADGTVLAVGLNEAGQCNTSDWTNIAAVYATSHMSLGLRTDGSVAITGKYNTRFAKICQSVSEWRDIVAISAGTNAVVGLRADGTVVAADGNDRLRRTVDDWKEIVGISSNGEDTVVGLKADGTIRTSTYRYRACENLVSVVVNGTHIMGIKANGAVVAIDDTSAKTGKYNVSQYDFSQWKLFHSVDTIAQERLEWIEDRVRRAEAKKALAYQEGLRLLKDAQKSKDINNALQIFTELQDYQDAKEYIPKCEARLHEFQMNAIYEMACAQQRKNVPDEIRTAQKLFQKLGTWCDSADRVSQCAKKLEKLERREALSDEKKKLENERANLGLFSGKRKKEIVAEIERIGNELTQLEKELS